MPNYELIASGSMPPIEASDPHRKCQLKWARNAGRYLGKNRMTTKHLLKLVEFLGLWSVRAVCFGVGRTVSSFGSGKAIRMAVAGG